MERLQRQQQHLIFLILKKEIDFIIEDNQLKQGKYIPGVNIPIVSKKDVKLKDPTVIVLAWNFFEEVKKNNKDLSSEFISIKELEQSQN